MRGFGLMAVLALAPTIACAQAQSGPDKQTFATTASPDNWAWTGTGFGVFTIDKGLALDLRDHSLDWRDHPTGDTDDRVIGYGWRGDRVQALVGYERRDWGPRFSGASARLRDETPWHGTGLVGLTIVLSR